MEDDWVIQRIKQAEAALQAEPNAVSPAVIREFATLLANGLQSRLKPEELKTVVSRLAAANRRAE
jgi:hypothetical protein